MTLQVTEEWADRIEQMVRAMWERMGPGGPVLVAVGGGERYYTVKEFARIVGEAEFTIRQKCNMGRIQAEKCLTRCGPSRQWRISQAELVRYQREGNLPIDAGRNDPDRRPAA